MEIYGNYATLGANTFTGDQTITSTDAGATVGPLLDLFRNSATPAASDVLGGVNFTGNSVTSLVKRTYGAIQARIVTATNAAEDGSLAFQTMRGGTLTDAILISQAGRLQFGGTSASFPALVANGSNLDLIKADNSDFAGIRLSTLTASSTISTGAPAGASNNNWKLGSLVTAAVVPDTTRSIFVDLGGTVYKLIVAQ